MDRFIYCLVIIISFIIVFCTGCGETVRGVSKDAHRVGKGVKTIFVTDE